MFSKNNIDIGKETSTKFALTIWLLSTLIIPPLITYATFTFLQKPHDKKMIELTQQYAYKNALAQKRLEYSEKIIGYRQMELTWLDRISNVKNKKFNKDDLKNIMEINLKIEETNSGSLLYAMQPYNAVMNYDDLFRKLFLDVLNNKIDVQNYKTKRKELGKKFDMMIDALSVNTTTDSAFINFMNKNYYDADRLK